MAIEMTHARPLHVFQQLDEEERAFGVVAAKAQILVEAANLLAVQVDVEQFARLERLSHGM